jgi:hypothetical protein
VRLETWTLRARRKYVAASKYVTASKVNAAHGDGGGGVGSEDDGLWWAGRKGHNKQNRAEMRNRTRKASRSRSGRQRQLPWTRSRSAAIPVHKYKYRQFYRLMTFSGATTYFTVHHFIDLKGGETFISRLYKTLPSPHSQSSLSSTVPGTKPRASERLSRR